MNFFTRTLQLGCIAAIAVACNSSDATTNPPVGSKYSVSGKITSSTPSSATQGVTVKFGSRSTTTNAMSAYVFDSVEAGTYTVMPELTGRTFTPSSRSVTVGSANVTNVDFTLEIPAVPTDSIQMVRVNAGTFRMGNHENQPYAFKATSPKHTVQLTRNYLVGIYEVTQEQWSRVIPVNASKIKGALLPVTDVSIDSIAAFCNRLSVQHGLTPVYTGAGKNLISNFNANGYRLPTEAEWEYAAQGGDTTLFPGIPDQIAGAVDQAAYEILIGEISWFAKNTIPTSTPGQPRQVGTKKPNAFGLYDVSGNVSEVCYGGIAPYTADAKVDPVVGPPITDFCVRGGYSRGDVVNNTIRARYFGLAPKDSVSNVGFRLVRTVP